MNPVNNFQKMDRIGQSILISMFNFATYYDNSPDEFGWFDSSGTTITKSGVVKKTLFEIKCNRSKADVYDDSIITKHDFDLLLANTPEDVEVFYACFTNNQTYIYNLRKLQADPSSYRIETRQNYNTQMGTNKYVRDEQWLMINRHRCKALGYCKLIKKGSLAYGYDIDKSL